MRLTRQTNYAIRILMYLAVNEGRLSRLGEIARSYSAPEPFMFKILNPLVSAGLVETIRGRNGGIRLGRDASKITLRDVVELTEESFILAECFETGADCPLISNCELNAALHQALESFLATLGRYTVADLTKDKGYFHRILDIEPVGAVA